MNQFPEQAADELADFRIAINNLSIQDFDGHTEFHKLKPEERLMWLSQAARFYFAHSVTTDNPE